MFRYLAILSVFLLNIYHARGDTNDDATRTMENLLKGYDKRFRPDLGGEPVMVGVTLYVLSINSLSVDNNEFTMDMYFRQFWKDPRLKFQRRGDLSKIVLRDSSPFWVPDTFFVNEKESSHHDMTVKNEFLRIMPTGEILKSIRVQVKANCPMNLQFFPFDSQLCYLEIESFGFTMSDIIYRWQDGLQSAQMSSDVSLPAYKVIGHRQRTIEASLSTGNYSRLALEIQFKRFPGYYITAVCVPMAMMVIISYIGMWVDPSNVMSRTLISLLTVLALSMQASMLNNSLPKVNYTKSIDIYTGINVTFGFLALLEYVTVAFLTRFVNNKMSLMGVKELSRQESRREFKVLPSDIENFSRVFFPVSYLGFQLWYFISMSSANNSAVSDLIHLNM